MRKFLRLATVLLVGTAASLFGDAMFGIEAMSIASLLPATSSSGLTDPGRIKRWSTQYFYSVQSKTVFDASFTGQTIKKDGPEQVDTLVGPPILVVDDLENRDGMVVTYTQIDPLFSDETSRMRYARVKGQTREGYEKTTSKTHIKFSLASVFWGVKEEDVVVGKKEIGMRDLAKQMTKLLSDNTTHYMDSDAIESWLMGHSRHLHTTIAVANGDSSGDVKVSEDLGVLRKPQEHRNTLCYIDGTLEDAKDYASNTSELQDKINETMADMEDTDTPDATFLDELNLEVKRRNIVGTQYIGENMDRTLINVIVDPVVMNRLRQATDYRDTVNSAYQAKGDEHPLIKQGDVVWGVLRITEEEKLLDPLFLNDKYHGGHDQDASSGTGVQVASGSGEVWLEKQDRVTSYSSEASFSFNVGDAAKLRNVMVLGANAIGRVPGPVMPLIPRTTDDYNRIKGLGAHHIFGHKRIATYDGSGNITNENSLRAVVYA